ncbi:hypothetical protein [Rhizobium sp. A37_96]
MMFYASKLVNDVMAKQEMADLALAGLSAEVQHAIALAEHFEHIHPDEYILPSGWNIAHSETEQIIASESGLWAAGFSRL